MTYNNDDFFDSIIDVIREKAEELGENCAATFEEAKQKLDDFINQSGGISGIADRASGLAQDVIKVINDKAQEMGKDLEEYLQEVQVSLEKCGGWGGLFDYAMNVEEKICDIITFEECLAWVKANLKAEIHGGAIIGKMKNKRSSDADAKKITLKVCFMDKNGKPLPDETSKHLIIRCNSFDGDLKNYFGDKDTIVLK